MPEESLEPIGNTTFLFPNEQECQSIDRAELAQILRNLATQIESKYKYQDNLIWQHRKIELHLVARVCDATTIVNASTDSYEIV